MKNLNTLLRDADPIGLETPVSPEDRARRRQVILAKTFGDRAAADKGKVRRYALPALVALAALAAALLWNMHSPLVREVHAAVNFEVRLAEDHPAPGLQAAKISGSGQVIYLHDEVVVANGDVERAEVAPGSSPAEFNVSVELTAAGGEKMRSITERNIGKRLAILLDGQVVMAPVIRSPISSSAMITGRFTRAEAERIVNGIR